MGSMGVRKMWHAMTRAGWDVGRDQVARLMRLAGIRGVVRGRKPRTTSPAKVPDHRPDLVNRNFKVNAPHPLWVADITYVRTTTGFCYTAFVTDALPLEALEQALLSAKDQALEGLVHHSDRGSQGGFNWSSQHLEHGGVWWDVRRRSIQRSQQVRGGSGQLIERCVRRCDLLGGLNRLERCSVNFCG